MAQGKEFEFTTVIPFHDLDPMHVVWHGNYLKYFDQARFGLFQAGGIDLYRYSLNTNCFFPVTKTSTKHIIPLKYGDRIICRAVAVEAWIKIVLDFDIRRVEDDVICAKGRGEQIAVQHPHMETLYEIPRDIRQALGCP